MYKKNSILDRKITAPSMRNRANADAEWEAQQRADAIKFARIRANAARAGASAEFDWRDPDHMQSTTYDKTHRLQTVVSDKGLVTIPCANVDIPSGVRKIPAPWERAENYVESELLSEVPTSPMSPTSHGAFSPSSARDSHGSPKPLYRDHARMVAEDDPSDHHTELRRVLFYTLCWRCDPPRLLSGEYDPIRHEWTSPPKDAECLDREALPHGHRSLHNHYRP
ncbi:uncharacterized protein MICPUCDRAFT_52537 [Micromonas pusilla CCMP1545]|uniref:Predicted protein n=1 Tax=Micromonas pusilla (strain CCMP1545) TaxID=564608 RepID=C1N4F4_MICPC|nr:uncharacterized protein MICPUCDRAFT_52537 [Micromonas pusilla CCMP1545]EEH52719.1 predicted protein [Micromonas pusilla CCMP1545]|eukprot:XP_003062780.1 predicted protein [Micromonas pusilla CCMP1545]